ncbi:MAG: GntR family transcriptional regulator [Desulfobacteraceae bacterium]|nr:MAG: GntR family transcriptional regulator [Desulfobacteraceae bacterium]
MLNPDSPIPLYRQLADWLMQRIRTGEYLPGSRIPSEHHLAQTHRLGRPTIRQALELLVRKGVLVRRRGSGTYVREPRPEVDLFSLDGTSASFRNKGMAVEMRLLDRIALVLVHDQAENPFSGQRAYYFSRLTRVGGTPVLLERIYLHAELFAGIEHVDLQGRSLSDIAGERFFLRPTGGRQSFRIGQAQGDDARHLEVTPQTPLLEVCRWLDFNQTAQGVFSVLLCRTDRFVFSQTIGGSAYA